MGRSCILDSPPPQGQGDARGSADAGSSADACLSQQKVQRREANGRCHRLTEPTPKALCQPPPPLPSRKHRPAVALRVRCAAPSRCSRLRAPRPS